VPRGAAGDRQCGEYGARLVGNALIERRLRNVSPTDQLAGPLNLLVGIEQGGLRGCDLRFASSNAVLGLTEARVGAIGLGPLPLQMRRRQEVTT
jgi:hypothetical protein